MRLRARRADPASVATVWDKTIEELDKGMCDGPWEKADMDAMFGASQWRAIRRFGIVQNGKTRACDDAKESLHNASTRVGDKMRTQRADFPARVADLFAERIGRGVRGWSLVHGTDDVDVVHIVVGRRQMRARERRARAAAAAPLRDEQHRADHAAQQRRPRGRRVRAPRLAARRRLVLDATVLHPIALHGV